MKASDLYGSMGVPSTQQETNPTDNTPGEKKAANNAARGKWFNGGYGTLAILAIAGILVGLKFAKER
jgi:predicted lipid-binding transport protein (Tim44 family)